MDIIRRIIKRILRITVGILFRVEIIGKENVPESGACIICPNHVSNWDPVVLVACTKRQVRMLAKEELYKNRFLRWIAKVFDMYPIKRNSGDIDAIKNSLRILKNGNILALYPEGTRNGLKKGIKPKNGAVLIALKSGASIIPTAMQGDFKLFKKVKLIYGKPISYQGKTIDTQNKEAVDNLTKELFDEIIMLRDKELSRK